MKKVLLLLLLILRQQYALEREAQAIRAQKLVFISNKELLIRQLLSDYLFSLRELNF